MQVTIDIPEGLYGELESRAGAARVSVERLVLDGALRVLSDIPSQQGPANGKPTLVSMNINLNDFALVTNEELETFEEAFAINPEEAVGQLGLRRLNDCE